MRDALAAGVTTVGDMGCAAPLAASLRALAREHPTPAPALVASGPLVTAPGGYPLDWMPPLFVKLGLALPCSDEEGAARAVSRIAASGMDHVKLAIMHESYAEKRQLRVLSGRTAHRRAFGDAARGDVGGGMPSLGHHRGVLAARSRRPRTNRDVSKGRSGAPRFEGGARHRLRRSGVDGHRRRRSRSSSRTRTVAGRRATCLRGGAWHRGLGGLRAALHARILGLEGSEKCSASTRPE